MEPPERLTVLTCIGCGAMTEIGTCASGCAETRLDLVPAEDFDRIKADLVHIQAAAVAFGEVAQPLAASEPAPQDVERAYCSLQIEARTALRLHPDCAGAHPEWLEPDEPAITWWCPRCGGLDAPQPCRGVCIRRPAEWVRYEIYERERERALRARDAERRLRQLTRAVAFVTPRTGQWERGWRAAHEWAKVAGAIARPEERGSGSV
jgi:hypothetical protein